MQVDRGQLSLRIVTYAERMDVELNGWNLLLHENEVQRDEGVASGLGAGRCRSLRSALRERRWPRWWPTGFAASCPRPASQHQESALGAKPGWKASRSERADKAIDLLGLARRAGKLTLGVGATEGALGRGVVCALVLARDTARGSAAKAAALARARKVPCYSFGSKAEFGRRFGRLEVAIVGVLDRSFAAALAEHFGQPTPSHGQAEGDSQ